MQKASWEELLLRQTHFIISNVPVYRKNGIYLYDIGVKSIVGRVAFGVNAFIISNVPGIQQKQEEVFRTFEAPLISSP